MKFHLNFSNDISLVYKLDTTVKSLPIWAMEISRMKVSDMCPINHKHSTNDASLIAKRIVRLYELADILNRELDVKIVKEPLTGEDRFNALNRMHIHFPNIHGMRYDKFLPLEEVASEYNDTIHWLEGEFRVTNGNMNFKMYMDFNKSGATKYYDINEDDFIKFNPAAKFGDLSLHYAQVGRHSKELLDAMDFDCPKDQFVPQTKFTGSIGLWFNRTPGYITPVMVEKFYAHWNNFYNKRGGKEFFGMEIDDPKMSFGYLHIGKLSEVKFKGNSLEFQTIEETEYIRQLLLANDITSFYVD